MTIRYSDNQGITVQVSYFEAVSPYLMKTVMYVTQSQLIQHLALCSQCDILTLPAFILHRTRPPSFETLMHLNLFYLNILNTQAILSIDRRLQRHVDVDSLGLGVGVETVFS